MTTGLALVETEQQQTQSLTLGVLGDRLWELQFNLEKVDGTLATILDVGHPDTDSQLSSKQLLGMVQLLADIVSPACEELQAIVEAINTKPAASTSRQGRKARVKQKAR